MSAQDPGFEYASNLDGNMSSEGVFAMRNIQDNISYLRAQTRQIQQAPAGPTQDQINASIKAAVAGIPSFSLAINNVSASRPIGPSDLNSLLVCVGTITLALPSLANAGDWYRVFNFGSGVITISGTINGGSSTTLATQYKYADFVSVDGVHWVIVNSN